VRRGGQAGPPFRQLFTQQEQAKHYGSLAKGIDPLGMLLAERPRLIHVGKAKRHNCG